jgi:hypothetical protein
MSEVRIVLDEGGYWRGVSDLTVRVLTDADHLRARRQLRERRPGQSMDVCVGSRFLFSRFDDLRHSKHCVFIEYDSRSRLADKLGVPLGDVPELLTEELITRYQLIDHATTTPPRGAESLTDWVLRVRMGPAWGRTHVGVDAIGPALTALTRQDEWAELDSVVRKRLMDWAQGTTWPEGWAWLRDDPAQRAKCVLQCWATSGYPEQRVPWLIQAGLDAAEISRADQLIGRLPKPDTVLANDADIPPELCARLGGALAERLAEEGMHALSLARAASYGETEAVWLALQDRASRGQLLATDEAAAVREWTQLRAGRPGIARLALLAEILCDAPLPRPCPETGSWEVIAQWLRREYLPAYLPRAATGQLQDLLVPATEFGDWLARNYHELHMANEVGAQHFLDGLAEKLREAAVVMLLLDGVPYAAALHLYREVESKAPGYAVGDELRLALLPTLTSVNKPAILLASHADLTAAADAESLATQWGLPPERVSVQTLTEARSLLEQHLSPGSLYVLHYRSVDTQVLHAPSTPWLRWLECLALMDRLAEEISMLCSRARQEGLPLLVGCISDHGWTELPSCALPVEIPEELYPKITHGRVLVDYLGAGYGLPLPANVCFSSRDYTIARGYRYYGSRPHGAVHGGATPQEVAVLGAWFGLAASAAQARLSFVLTGAVVRGRSRNEALLEITNSHPSEVIVNCVDVPRLSLGHGLPMTIAGHATVTLEGTVDATGVTGDTIELAGSADLSLGTRSTRQKLVLRAATTGAMRQNTDFESMWGV